ncbi:50S ribosomal protein L15 [Candidatus Pacearchaeota archaeon]|nr:50S ribosomal protein L15 [Candidatus Pacearchaeota archaeon]
MVIKFKKTKKSLKKRGTNNYHGVGKKHQGSGNRGGIGMAGTGKRADHKKSLVDKKYGGKYFGKQGITSKSTVRKKNNVMNLRDIENNYDSILKKYGKDGVIVLKTYKILGEGKFSKKISIKARAFSKSAKESIEKAGGKVELFKVIEKAKVDEKKTEEKVEKKKEKEKNLVKDKK